MDAYPSPVRAAAVLLAGGDGTRMGIADSKVFAEVQGRPLLAYGLVTCAMAPSVGVCVVVARTRDLDRVRTLADGLRQRLEVIVVAGGADRHASEQAGLAALRPAIRRGEVEVVAIHDAARPFATVELYERSIAAAMRHGGAVPGLPFPHPLLDRSGVRPVLDANTIVSVQTPQAFRAYQLLEAFDTSADAVGSPVDTAEAVQRMGEARVVVIVGDKRNLKVTYPDDVARAAALARRWAAGSWSRHPS